MENEGGHSKNASKTRTITKSAMNTQNGLITDMAKNGHSIGPRVVHSDPWVVRDARLC